MNKIKLDIFALIYFCLLSGFLNASNNRFGDFEIECLRVDIGEKTNLDELKEIIIKYYSAIINKNYTEAISCLNNNLPYKEKMFSPFADRIYHKSFKISESEKPIKIFSIYEIKDDEFQKIVLVTLSVPVESQNHTGQSTLFKEALPLTDMFVYEKSKWTVVPLFLAPYLAIDIKPSQN
ncbi:MAG: hypothetical protein NZM04_08050 [Methylacidiphilales bacterium]|nr:hypothetical protein [Candidatus Methylacidiphilales bacterium]